MPNSLLIVLLSVVIALSLTIAPEEPKWIEEASLPSSNNNNKNAAVRFVGGDGKTKLTGHWHLPSVNYSTEATQLFPVIVLAHGMGLIQSSGLTPFIDAFTATGFAVFTFDYATFGRSDGFPRHQIHPQNHISDIKATVAMITKNEKNMPINVNKIGLWGTSLGGGHVLEAAASDNEMGLKAVVSQVPHIASGLESVVLGFLLRTPVSALQGLGAFFLGLVKWSLYRLLGKTAYFPIVGPPGSAAMLQDVGDEEGYLRFLAPGRDNPYGWTNAATTNSGLHIVFGYRPLNVVQSIQSPVLLVAAENDTLCPAKYVKQAYEAIPNAEYLFLSNTSHFEIYDGGPLQEALRVEVDFFKKHLL